MATAQAQLTPTANTSPATVSVPTAELSGPQWVARFPGSNQVSDCAAPFSTNLQSFISAMEAAGATVTVSATYRPPERAYLMHWAYVIANQGQDPRTVPAMAGVNIKWDHAAADGSFSSEASVSAAQAMVLSYGMQSLNTPPALSSRHTMRLAVDMSIAWTGDLTINKADGTSTTITSTPKTGMNTDLKAVGATYSVIKYVGGNADKPHWSDTGH
jgi:hypothetical protein